MLKNAKDAAATEALEIATYTAIERLARAVGDDETAKLAASIRADEEQMLERVLKEIPKLTDAVVQRRDRRQPRSYDLTKTGAADATKKVARQARKVPGVAQAEGEIKGAVATESDLADRALRQPHRGRDHEQADRPLADRSGQGRRLRAPRAEPHDGPRAASTRSAATSRGRATTS